MGLGMDASNQSAKTEECPTCNDADVAHVVGCFYETFSNFEYALKRVGCVIKGKNSLKQIWEALGDNLTQNKFAIR